MFHTKEKFGDWKNLGELCCKIAKAIGEYRHAKVSICWKEDKPIGYLEFNTEDAYWLTIAIKSITNKE